MKNLKILILFEILLIISAPCFPQNTSGKSVPETIIPLIKSTEVKHEYVNFDVLRLVLGHGLSTDKTAANPFAFSWNVQLMYPYAMLRNKNVRFGKEKIFLATGLRIGRSRIAWKNTVWPIVGNGLSDPEFNINIYKSTIRTGYVGLLILPFMQMGQFNQWTLMAGTSVGWNYKNRMIYKSEIGRTDSSVNQQVRKFTFPCIFQVSRVMNKTKTLSIGVFSSYLFQQFKNDNIKDVDQLILGFSGSIVI